MHVEPFSLLASVYDEIMLDVQYEQWTDFILKTLVGLNWQGKKILDLGCGTGNSTFPFFTRGFEIAGLDGSTEMLKVAHKKLPPVKFFKADFETFELDENFDLVVSVFDSLNNLLTTEAFLQTAKQVYKHLNTKGIFMFDVNTSLGLKNLWDKGKAEGWINDVHYYWQHSFDEAKKLARIEAYCSNNQSEFTEIHYERPYEPSEISQLLTEANFQNVQVISFPSGKQACEEDMRVWGIGQKAEKALINPSLDNKMSLMKKIVAVDDQVGQLRVLEMLLTIEHELITLKDGKEVLEYLKENTPDLIILDVNMPYMSGIDVCGRIKRIERLKKVPVIILTGDRDKKLQEEAKVCGADDFVTKPLTGRDFTQKVENLLKLNT